MEFTIDRPTLQSALYKTQGIVDKKSTMNVLAHVLIESTDNEHIRVVSTDYDVVLVSVHPCEVSEPGAIAVNGRYAFEVVRNLPLGPVKLKSQPNHWVQVTCGRADFKLVGIPAEDFPEQAAATDVEYLSIPRATLLGMIDRTVFSVSTDESRMNLNGVFMQVTPLEDGARYEIRLVSTDGHRLSLVRQEVASDTPVTRPLSAIIHRKGIVELRRVLEGSSDTVQFGIYRNNIVFRYEETVVFVRQIEETFPEYQKVVPVAPRLVAPVDRTSFIEAVRRTATLTSAKTAVVKLTLMPGRLLLSTTNPEFGEAHDELDTSYDGREVTVGFNHRYLLDVLAVLSGESVKFSIDDEFSPGLLTSDDEEGSRFVIMPIRI